MFDAEFNGQPRKLLAQASPKGYFFRLDRTNGKHILTIPYGNATWAKGLNAQKNGQIRWHAGVGSSVSNGPMTYQLGRR